ncbi:fructoselysine-6-P-deglycase FrlB-like protein [Thermasporomyces composti]|jgi:fructoselysine-6-P-deglycase FrlB-like protein|uniref:Fructoselysine-6-P-deglycase FrlB-like protein n=2 Tax=Thermasporomyces composti TaxID=696763 RepID=A0A3D9VEX9_THECX|nr:fructoselysine-6-P-deglycase FrlB-like protein [Thermasporomyces composti]
MLRGQPITEGAFMQFVTEEIASQPACWRQAATLARTASGVLPREGERVAVIGCGTSWFMAQSYAVLREAAGHGETDAFPASEFPAGRRYDRVVALTRSGTTTEVLARLSDLRGRTPTVAVTADPKTPVMDLADEVVVLEFADERSVVQTRFATSALTLLRAHLGADVDAAVADAEQALAEPLPDGATERRQFTFLGTGWTVGLANEAALKMREASLSWTESYPAMEYRHGPMSITDASSVVWFLGTPPPDLPEEVRRLGAMVVTKPERDPLAELIRAQRLAVEIGVSKGLNPDQPRNLTRSVILSDATTHDKGASTS